MAVLFRIAPVRKSISRRIKVNDLFLKLYVRFQLLLNREDGQDLVEYALLIALIALAAVSGTRGVATAVNGEFNKVSTTLA
jgi:pilus assembly protein Flp/PilA